MQVIETTIYTAPVAKGRPHDKLGRFSSKAGLVTLQDRFWEKVNKLDGCWEWTAFKNDGYGVFKVGGVIQLAHRVAYELVIGKIPEGMIIDHLCRNRGCVNPAHMEVVNNRTNVLRGVSIVAKNALATHCPQGHPYDLFNTIIRPHGHRGCRYCNNHPKSRGRQ